MKKSSIANKKKGKEKSTTIPGISNWFEWSWPIEGDDAQIQKFLKNEINKPSPQLSEPTKPKSPWKIPIPHASGKLHKSAEYIN